MAASLGIGIVAQRFIPHLRAEGRDDEADGLIGATTRLSVAVAIVGCVLLFAFLYWPGTAATEGGSETTRNVVIALALTWFLVWRMADVYQFYLRGEQRFGELARLSAYSAVLKLSVTALGAWLFGIPGALAGFVVANVLPASRIGRLLRVKPFVGQQLKHEVVRFALTSWVTAVLGALVFGRTEIIFLEHYTGIGAVGFFVAAVTVVEMAVQLPPLLLSALLPRFSEHYGLGAQDDMHRLYRTMTALIAMVIVPLCLGLAAIAPVLVPLLFGAEFDGAIGVASVLLIAAAISSLGVTTAYLLQSMGKVGFLLISNGVGLIGTVALGFVLIPRYGLMGAAWSRGIVQISVVLIETWYVARRLNISPPFRALVAITLASAAQGAVAYLIIREFGGAISVIGAIVAAIFTFLVAVRLLAIIPMVAPQLAERLANEAPRRIRPLVSLVMKVLSPRARDAVDPK